jgi:hypothetical protein
MKRPGTFLALLGLLLILFGGLWMRVAPPGGVAWPFFTLAAAIPVGAVIGWRRGAMLRQVASYLLVTGAFFAAGVTFDGQEGLRVLYERDTQLALWSRFAAVAAAVWVASGLALAMSRPRSQGHIKPTEGEPGAAPNGGPATPVGSSGVAEGPPSVS